MIERRRQCWRRVKSIGALPSTRGENRCAARPWHSGSKLGNSMAASASACSSAAPTVIARACAHLCRNAGPCRRSHCSMNWPWWFSLSNYIAHKPSFVESLITANEPQFLPRSRAVAGLFSKTCSFALLSTFAEIRLKFIKQFFASNVVSFRPP